MYIGILITCLVVFVELYYILYTYLSTYILHNGQVWADTILHKINTVTFYILKAAFSVTPSAEFTNIIIHIGTLFIIVEFPEIYTVKPFQSEHHRDRTKVPIRGCLK